MQRPNIIVIVLDTLRVDAVSCYGYQGYSLTPVLDQVAREGTLFWNAIAPTNWSLPSYASLFTGLYPAEHGADQVYPYLDRDIPTLAEIMSRSGYVTLGFSDNAWVGQMSGLDRGFQEFNEVKQRYNRPLWARAISKLTNDSVNFRKRANVTIGKAIERIRNETGNFFLFVCLMENHLPYAPPPRYFSRVKKPSFNLLDVVRVEKDFRRYLTGAVDISQRALDTLKALHYATAAYVDDEVDRLLAVLRETNRLDNTLLIILSDHGDNIGDHGLMSHAFCLYDTLIKVPLLVRYPPLFPENLVYREQVQTVDIFKTILEVAGVQPGTDVKISPRRSLLARVKGEPATYEFDDLAFAEHSFPKDNLEALKKFNPSLDDPRFEAARKCVRTLQFKYIWSDKTEEEFYDLQNDPDEQQNLAPLAPHAMAQLKQSLAAWSKQQEKQSQESAPPIEDIDPEVVNRLRDLGYIA